MVFAISYYTKQYVYMALYYDRMNVNHQHSYDTNLTFIQIYIYISENRVNKINLNKYLLFGFRRAYIVYMLVRIIFENA